MRRAQPRLLDFCLIQAGAGDEAVYLPCFPLVFDFSFSFFLGYISRHFDSNCDMKPMKGAFVAQLLVLLLVRSFSVQVPKMPRVSCHLR